MTSTALDTVETAFRALLAATRAVHEASPDLCDFADWPTDLEYRTPRPHTVHQSDDR